MNEIKIFKNPIFGEIRTAGTADNPQFCLADVCKALKLQPNKVAQRISKDVLSKYPLSTEGGEQLANFVNEDGLYDVILDSRKKEAKTFRKWVTSEVLPSIRKSGGYMIAAENETPEETMARALLIAEDAIKRRDQRIRVLQHDKQRLEEKLVRQQQHIQAIAPRASLISHVMISDTILTTTQLANQLGMTARDLNEKLALCGIIYRQSGQWLLHTPYKQLGLHATRYAPVAHEDGSVTTNVYTVWRTRGCIFVHTLAKCGWDITAAMKRITPLLSSDTLPEAATV